MACSADAPSSAATAAGDADDQTDTLPASTGHSRTAKLERFLKQEYGDQAQLAGQWTDAWAQQDAIKLQRRVCAEQPVLGDERWLQLLAVCGELHEEGNQSAPGTIDFFVLGDAGDHFTQVSALTDQTFGSFGNPGSAAIIRVGRDTYGFRVDHGMTAQGYTLMSQDLVLATTGGLVAAGSLRRHIDNTSAHDCSQTSDQDERVACLAEVFDVDFELKFDTGNPDASIWPLAVLESGYCGDEHIHRAHDVSLDQHSWTYAFPEALQRESCS